MLRNQPFMRDDTFLGVCHALGQDLHIPANLFRVALAPLLIMNPAMTLMVYAAAAVVIAIMRFVFPDPAATASPASAAPVEAATAEELPPLAKAA